MISLVSFCSVDAGDGVKLVADKDGEKISLIISADDFLSLSIVKGECDEALFEEISASASNYSAYKSAIRMLSACQCSKKAIYDKLRRRSFSHSASLFAAEKAFSAGYINEKWQIENYLATLICKKFCGRRKAVPFLLAKGYKSADINASLEENFSERDFAKAKEQFLLKKFGKTKAESAAELAEMKKALYKQGF